MEAREKHLKMLVAEALKYALHDMTDCSYVCSLDGDPILMKERAGHVAKHMARVIPMLEEMAEIRKAQW